MLATYQGLLDELRRQGVLKLGSRLEKVFAEVDRVDFVRSEDQGNAYVNSPLYIGEGQTISQPFTVAFMLNLLDVGPGDKVLEVGFGSGWQTVILSKLAGSEGEVHATEIIPDLKEFGDKNIRKYSPKNVRTYVAEEGELGVPKEAPFDRIIVGAAGRDVPKALIDQLSDDGVLVMPVVGSIMKIKKRRGGGLDFENHPGFAFVPLVE